MLPELTTISLCLGTSTGVGKKFGNGEMNYGVSTTVAGVSTTSGTSANAILDNHYQELINDCQKVETTTAYVQQLSDQELEKMLGKYGLLEKTDENNVKVL